jgi:hypothetical protein
MFVVHFEADDGKACCGELGAFVLSADRDLVDCEECIALMPPDEPPDPDGECYRGSEYASALAEEQARVQRELK